MNRNRIFLMATVLLVLAGGVIWMKTSTSSIDQPSTTGVAEECNSCTARHRRLSRLRDARSSEEKRDE